jgi:nitrile hydratase accessory protein
MSQNRFKPNRNLVTRFSDGRLVNVARMRGHLFVCHENCCCGRVEDGFAPVPVDRYQDEWESRRLRNVVHLTIGGCLGPCALANVAMLLFDGRAYWFHSVDDDVVGLLFEWIDSLLEREDPVDPPFALAEHRFTASTWQDRPDGAPVDDHRPRSVQRRQPPPRPAWTCQIPEADSAERAVADMSGSGAMPRKNGELVFEAPWEGRAFGMAVALSELGEYDWESFRQRLIATISDADAEEPADAASPYYQRWLAALESLLAESGLIDEAELAERTFQFEFGERDEVY